MQYKQCKCGGRQRWDSGEVVQPCEGCSKCGTTFADGPDGHKALEPHDWQPRYDRVTGKPDRRECSRCHALERTE